MPTRGFGVSFMPGTEQMNGEAGANGQPRTPVQEAIQVLSLRLPKVFGARPVVPEMLAGGPGGMGLPGAKGNATAQALAQMAGLPPGMVPPTMPAPMPFPPMAGPQQPTPPWSVPDTPDRPRPDSVLPVSPPSSTPPPLFAFPNLTPPTPIPTSPPSQTPPEVLSLPPTQTPPYQRPSYKQDLLDMFGRYSY